MGLHENEADVFAIPRLWQPSKWLNEGPVAAGQFFSTELAGFTGNSAISQNVTNGLLNASESTAVNQQGFPSLLQLLSPKEGHAGFFKPPSFESPAQQTHEAQPLTDLKSSDSPDLVENDADDLWENLDAPQAKPPTHKTWDGFLSGEQPASQPIYLSEAGPAAYDALLSWDTDPLGLKNTKVPVVQAQIYLSALLSLAVGRESVFFTKSQDGRTLRPALPVLRLPGYSSDAIKGLENKCLQCGETFLGLRAFVQTSYTRSRGRCTIGLSSALDRILQILQRELDIEAQDPRSLLQLQSTINNVSGMLQPLRALMTQIGQGRSDESILSLIFKHACVIECKEVFVRDIMQEILKAVSLPWLESLEEWIGTKVEHGIPFTKSNIGETRGFVTVQSETCIDDFGEEFEDVDYRLNQEKLPDFFPADMAQLAFDTGKNLRFIRSSCPEHPLSKTPKSTSSRTFNAPETEWAFGWSEVIRLEHRVAKYQRDLKDVLSGALSQDAGDVMRSTPSTYIQEQNFSVFGSTELQIESMFLQSMQQLQTPIHTKSQEDRFATILDENLRRRISPRNGHHLVAGPHPSLLPILSFGGIISAQSEVINRESLKLLFDAHDLRCHLKLHRDFHMLGNGMFCTRLSHALFNPDLETAERQAGIARQGGVMGLRLGARDTWPPASSELRLALMGILTDSFIAEQGSAEALRTAPGKTGDGLPGDLSFAVRDLSPEDIEKCMNPDSLEALDFLRLAYTAPPELRVIITPVILMQYDRIFKFLIRLLRLMYVVDQLFRVVNLKTSAWDEPGPLAYRFAREARHFVSCISAYFLDTGIALPWQAFEAKMDQMQAELAGESNTPSAKACSPETLAEYHSQAVNQIISALFLRKRQQQVLKLLEDIFVLILTYAKHAQLQAMGSVVDGDHTKAYSQKLYREFRKKLQVFVTVCRTLTEKTKSGAKERTDGVAQSDGLGDDSLVAQLLLKLDMNSYYTRS